MHKILVIDDDKITHAFVKRALAKKYAITYTFRGEQGLAALKNHFGIDENSTITPEGYFLKEPKSPMPCDTTGKVWSNTNGSYWTGTDVFDVKLSPTQYWIMGDNRRGSCDCRVFGPIEARLIHAKIMYRIWSNDSNSSWWIMDLLTHPIRFFKNMRTSRFFQRVV